MWRLWLVCWHGGAAPPTALCTNAFTAGRRAFFVFLITVGLTFGFPQKGDDPNAPRQMAIHGVVLDPGMQQPVAGALVSLIAIPDKQNRLIGVGVPKEVISTAETDSSGRFSFEPDQPGLYTVEVKKDEYGPVGPIMSGLSTTASLMIDKNAPVREVRLLLARLGRIAGHVVDKEGNEPVANMPVTALQAFYQRGQRRLIPGGSGITDSDGRFVIRGISSAQYLLAVGPRLQNESGS